MEHREQTLQDYYKRINTVLEYINNNLGEKKIKLEKLAEVSNFAIRHLQRIMKAHLNETIGAYIVRTRLDTAAKLIIYSKEQISDIALNMGYLEISSFSKAFKKRFGISPNEYRKGTKEFYFNQINLMKTKKAETMELKEKIVNTNPKKVVFVQVIGYYSSNKPTEAWQKLWAYIEKNKLSGPEMEYYGIIHDDTEITEAEKCRYDACITIDTDLKPEGQIGVKKIQGGKYAVFTYKGPYKNLNEIYNEIYGEWFPKSGVELAETPLLEKYLNDPSETKPEDLLTEIYIPLK